VPTPFHKTPTFRELPFAGPSPPDRDEKLIYRSGIVPPFSLRGGAIVSRLGLVLALLVGLAGCGGGVTTPCGGVAEAQDPTGICASSHSHTGGV
jgi:hypothetical protein